MISVKERFFRMEQDALREEYKGIFTENENYDSLFTIKATNISTDPIIDAATKFLNNLSPEQLDATTFKIDDNEWRKWSNVDNGIYDRQGISLKEMNSQQKKSRI